MTRTKHTRLQKVYYGHDHSPFSQAHPVIRIGGKYLERFGFAIGDRLEIHFSHEQIVINKIVTVQPSEKDA